MMKLKNISKILSGYISRGKIEAQEKGSHFLLQARDVDGNSLEYQTENLIRFNPNLSAKDLFLEKDDILFMARGMYNFSVLLDIVPESTLAAACFFVIRTTDSRALPAYLCWYLNQAPVAHYLKLYSGKGVHMPVVKRAVLENLGIPLPHLEKQEKIAQLGALQRREQQLVERLMKNRKRLIAAACLEAVTKS